jgi:hypothetical protein
MKSKIAFLMLCVITSGLWAQGVRDSSTTSASARESDGQIPLKRVVILTSGIAYYEHSGSVSGPVRIDLPFRYDAVNDALKSLVINDPSSANPSIIYQSEQTLVQTLRSLKIDLSNNPGLANIFERLIGAEVEISSNASFSGRITGIEYRPLMSSNMQTMEPWLLLSTQEGMRTFNLREINSIRFMDQAIERDLNRALDLISASRNTSSRQLTLSLPGSNRRDVSISYIIPSPVWKISYRLDLGASRPLFQGWAIVDNDSDNDWNNVELSLVAGRPSSFIQNLYPPYYVSRPVLPLSIAGTAAAVAYDQSYGGSAYSEMPAPMPAADMALKMEQQAAEMDSAAAYRIRESSPSNLTGGVIETAAASAAGGQFEFTIRTPVSLDRRMSAMLPLVESPIEARKLDIYSGSGRHPRLGAELTNTSGMRLPAGSVTVYDGGVYAGDALLEFWNENEKRLISFGDDLSVTAVTGDANSRVVSSVNVSGGVMTINRSMIFTKTYTFVSSSSVSKSLVVEHQKTSQTDLVSPQANEQTASAYRFNVTLPANRETVLTVNEQRPISERIALLSLRQDTFLSYTTNQEIPPRVREALQRAVELRRAYDAADLSVKEIETQRSRLIADQDRIRRNLEAAGNQSAQGQEYLNRLVSLDGEIDALSPALDRANNNAKAAREAWENYLNGLNF